MSDNPQEQTEAKLLAYIEGELDESGRAEIDRHLAANPKHRRLLADLLAGRSMVRRLPRESAPPELFDGFQTQLERQLLLDGAVDINPETGNIRINRWVRIRAAAAAVVLATGLGVIVYNALPRQGGQVAITPPEAAPPTSNAGAATERSRVEANSLAQTRRKEAFVRADRSLAFDQGKIAGSTTLLADASSRPSLESRRELEMAGAANSARSLSRYRLTLDIARKASTSTPAAAAKQGDLSDEEPVFLVVASADPSSAQEEVMRLLRESGLPYRQLDSLRSADDRPGNAPLEKQFSQEADKGSEPMPGVPAPAMAPTPHPTPELAPAAPAGTASRPLPTAPALQPLDAPAAFGSQPAATQASTTQPATTQQLSVQDAASQPHSRASGSPDPRAPEERSENQQPESLKRSGASDTLPATQSAGIEQVLIVRNVPRNQAAKLLQSLNRPQSAQYASAFGTDSAANRRRAPAELPVSQPAGAMAMRALPSSLPVAKSASSDKRDGPGLREAAGGRVMSEGVPATPTPSRGAGVPASTNPAKVIERGDVLNLVYHNIRQRGQPLIQRVIVSKEGTIYVASLGPVELAGLTPQQATDRVNGGFKQKGVEKDKSMDAPVNVEIRRPSADELAAGFAAPAPLAVLPPASGPVAIAAPVAPSTSPAPAPIAPTSGISYESADRLFALRRQTFATTEPDPASTAKSEADRSTTVDIVIVFHRSSLAGEPTTQP